MAYTIYQYATVTPDGLPVEPYTSRTAAQAFGAAVQMDASTRYVAVIPDAAMRLRISGDGAVAAQTDHLIPIDEARGFPIAERARPYLYGVADT